MEVYLFFSFVALSLVFVLLAILFERILLFGAGFVLLFLCYDMFITGYAVAGQVEINAYNYSLSPPLLLNATTSQTLTQVRNNFTTTLGFLLMGAGFAAFWIGAVPYFFKPKESP